MNHTEWTVLDNSNIVESYPGLTLPLTHAFIRIAYEGVFRGLVGTILKNDVVLDKYSDIFANMIADYQGRVYYRINNWYSLIDFLPFSRKIIPIWQDMMGVQNTDIYLGIRHKFTLRQKAAMNGRILKLALSVPREMDRLNRDFQAVQNTFAETYQETMTNEELLALFQEIKDTVLTRWSVTLANDMYAFIWTGLLKRRLARQGSDVTQSIAGITALESLKPLTKLLDIAQHYAAANSAETGAEAASPEPTLSDTAEVREYLALYGDRCPGELKLETVTYREDPSLLEAKIREYAADPAKLDQIVDGLRRQETLPLRNSFIAKRARLGIKNREISRLNRSRIYGMVRRIFLTIGANLHRDGCLDAPTDVFYLTVGEIAAWDNPGGGAEDFKGIIAQRREEYTSYARLPTQPRLVFRGGELLESKITPDWTGIFQGVGASFGNVTAAAVVLESPHDNVDVKGKIIVTKTTDPGWVFLLTMAAGIVAEKGSLLSHTAIVSRELKIPAVVAVTRSTSVIQTGDLLSIDGGSGEVRLLKEA
ncbi:MAG: PEP-utilizing enzyme [Peptococcaceae bacterium]|nr:PEP-utilizing enzyme [Peptococcaceae bacterium]